ncbi:hypothetical protein FALBO_10663 [Fusarium albosuccineum]|uniref:Uncharacterized protein n=1 Tax=Fusarium albosuccineum TaxID=1237068 RepID=A0A8H4L3Q4_9HYPO|nr:hypothetical protein FALBO_10663 [Fusarium albosuccineum]
MNREQMIAVARNLDELEVKVNQLLLITLDLRSENESLRTEKADLRAKHQSQVVALCAEIKRLKKKPCNKSDRVLRAGGVEKKCKKKISKKRAPSHASRYNTHNEKAQKAMSQA